MNDFEFGNCLYNLRIKSKLTQNDMAKKLGITNKAISKWENGKAKPTLNMLKKISILFDIPIEELMQIKQINNKSITKIVITGGPCSGKTTSLKYIKNYFSKIGYHVMIIDESATELINSGISYDNINNPLNFQNAVINMQIEKEKIYNNAAKNSTNDKILIICDRGSMDSKVYLSDLDFSILLNNINKTEIELRDNYDAVFHLITVAKKDKELYSTDNNKCRIENKEEAIISDNKTIEAWAGHPHFRIIDNYDNFDIKIKKLLKEISLFLGEPIPYEIERKFLIEYPNINSLNNNKACKKIEIMQTYLKSNGSEEIRIRQRGSNGDYIYTKTVKNTITNLKRSEIEKRISKDEYINLLMEADINKAPIRKTRYCLTYKNKNFEIDIYPNWNDKAILEIELNDENEKFEIPNELKIIKEVTNDPNYKNNNLSKVNNKL